MLDPEEELRRDQHRRERELQALERPVSARRRLGEHALERRDVGRRDRPPVGAAGEGPQNAVDAQRARRWIADECLPADDRGRRRLVRPGDVDELREDVLGDVGPRLDRNRLQRLVVHEPGAERVLVAGDEDPYLLQGPLRRAPLLVDGVDLDRHADRLHRLPVDADHQRHRRIVGAAVPGEADLDRVVGVVLEDGLQLDDAVADPSRPAAPGEDARLGQRTAADRARGDLFGRGQVLLHERRRDREHVADVVEAVARIVGREFVGRAEVDPEQIADRVGVLDAVQAVDRDVAGIRLELPIVARELTLDIRDQRRPLAGRERLLVGWRHVPRFQLLDNQFPRVAFGRDRRGIRECREVQAGVRLLLVVAAAADFVEHRADVAIERRRDRGLGMAGRPDRDQAHEEHERENSTRGSHCFAGLVRLAVYAVTSLAALVSTPGFCRKPRSRNQSMNRSCQVPNGSPLRSFMPLACTPLP